VDISPSGRLFIKERDIIVKLYEGIKSLMAKEREEAGLPPLSASGLMSDAGIRNAAKMNVGGKDSRPVAERVSVEEIYENFLKRLEAIRASHPANRCAKYMTRELFMSFPPDQRDILYRCCKTGADNPDSGIGCYILTPDNLKQYRKFFDPLIRDYHKASATDKHVTDWDISSIGDKGVLDLTKLGLSDVSMRVRVGRNLKRFNLPGNMSKAERVQFEKAMLQAFSSLKANPAFGGKVYSLTPEFGPGEANPNLISKQEYQQLVDAHIMFKDMDADPYLKSAGISADWPYGRGCYVSDDGQVIIWMGEEDQLRIMCMKKGTRLNEVFDRLHSVLDTFEKIPGIEFAVDPDFGYITSCPSNLGTGMRASVHVKIPHLTKDGTDTKAKAICKEFGLSVRGLGGEHTPIGADGTVDISPSGRLFIKERDIIVKLYEGIKSLMAKEREGSGLPPLGGTTPSKVLATPPRGRNMAIARSATTPSPGHSGRGLLPANRRYKTTDVAVVSATSDEELRALFKVYDVDGTGFLSKEEFMLEYIAMERAVGIELSDRQVDRLFSQFDKSGDGKLSFEEFAMLMLRRAII
jgi:creatine kinase